MSLDPLDRRARPLRVRQRQLASGASSAEIESENTWDDVPLDPLLSLHAQQLIREQRSAPPEVGASCIREAERRWDAHYASNARNYKDRHYLLNEFPQLRSPPEACVILETGCGVGNSMLPLLASLPSHTVVGCDVSGVAIDFVNRRLRDEQLDARGSAHVWDIARPPSSPQLQPSSLHAGIVLAVFTLSALAPSQLGAAFANLFASLRPGGRLLIRDYGRLDSKQLKFCKRENARIGEGEGLEWYARGDGTTVLFFTVEAVVALASAAGFEVEDARYDRRWELVALKRPSLSSQMRLPRLRLVVNRAEHTRMYRVWLVAVLRRPLPASQPRCSAAPALPDASCKSRMQALSKYSKPYLWGAVIAATMFAFSIRRGLRMAYFGLRA